MLIRWTDYGKVKEIDTIYQGNLSPNIPNSTPSVIYPRLKFKYDATGNRLEKEYVGHYKDIYLRDPQGNVMAVYRIRKDSLYLYELPLYGSSRLGVIKENKLLKVKTAQNNTGVMSLPIPVNIAQSKNTTKPSVYTMGKKHYESTDWLGNVRVTYTDKKSWSNGKFALNVSSSQDYYPFGSVMEGRDFETINYRFGFGGHEKDNEVKGCGNHLSFGDMGYDPRISRRWRIDPFEFKYSNISSYTVFNNNPINFIDQDGKEPIKPLVGTAAIFRALLDNSPRKVGMFKGQEASDYLKSLGNTEWSWKQMRPLPTQTGYFNNKKGRYIYTEKGGWIDMVHFLFYAGKAYQYKLEDKKNPIGEAVQDGYKQEETDKYVASHSAYSYEDLPSDKFGADFAVNYFDPNSDLTFGEQVENYLNNILKATKPENAPNFDSLPVTEPTKPSRTNTSTTPVYTEENP